MLYLISSMVTSVKLMKQQIQMCSFVVAKDYKLGGGDSLDL